MIRYCPYCKAELEPVYEEIDIGVGMMRRLVGAQCKGGDRHVFAACNTCEQLDVEGCAPWCRELA